ncbi:MAG: monovalent cation/H+ antiporter complex subunit F [Dehalococcoidia bacterium]
MNWDGLLSVIQPMNIVYAMLTIALLLAFARLARGPSLPDRVVALDLITVITVGFIAAYAIDVEQRVFLDAAIVVALIAFLGTVAFARYVERGAENE